MYAYRIILFAAFSCSGFSFMNAALAQDTFLTGKVLSSDGAYLPFANLQLKNSYEGTATNTEGTFGFSTALTGEQTLLVRVIGYEPYSEPVFLFSGDTLFLNIILKETLIQMDEAIVTASSYATGDAEQVTLESLEVVTTPGAAADIFLAIKTLPGVAMVDEGAGLFVRGGDINETVILLDQATIIHPYKYDSPTGGVFGTIPPFLVAGTNFSTGGFSAKYGNALSGILSMDSKNLPPTSSYTLNLGLAAASVAMDIPLKSNKFGIRFSGNRSFTRLMMRLNDLSDGFTETPEGWDGNISLIYQYSPTGRLKWFNFGIYDRIGVRVTEPSFDGIYRGSSTSSMHNLQWSDVRGKWFIQSSLSFSQFSSQRSLGSLDLKPVDRASKFRIDLEKEATEDFRLRWGLETEQLSNELSGKAPSNTAILAPDAETSNFDFNKSGWRTGAYSELEWKSTRRLALVAGLRSDFNHLIGTPSFDPRFSLQLAINKDLRTRFAWGMYHQSPLPQAFESSTGTQPLTYQRAYHWIAGLHAEKGLLLGRLEGYYKMYQNLLVETNEGVRSNAGTGEAYGMDLFLKYGGFLASRANGWISYSLLRSVRTQIRSLGTTYLLEEGRSPYDITHNLTVVGKLRVFGFLSTGLTYRYATGRPITPILSALPVNGKSYFLPIEGPVGSQRLPAFERVDMQVSYYLPFKSRHNATFYMAISNLLNRRNVLGYDYSADYSVRRERKSNYSRFLYFGFVLNFNRIQSI